MARVGGGICPGWVNVESACAADLAMTGIFGRSRVPKIAQGLSMFIYYALEAERGIPVDGPVLPSMAPCFPLLLFLTIPLRPDYCFVLKAVHPAGTGPRG